MKLPFEFTLPVDAPPSFSFEDYMNAAHVRYAIEATGVRSGPFAFDQTLRIPLVVVVPDPLGSSLRPQLKLGWQDGWGRMRMERMRVSKCSIISSVLVGVLLVDGKRREGIERRGGLDDETRRD